MAASPKRTEKTHDMEVYIYGSFGEIAAAKRLLSAEFPLIINALPVPDMNERNPKMRIHMIVERRIDRKEH